MSLFSWSHWPSRLRLLLARRPWIYWLVVAALTAGVVNTVVRASMRIEHERASWGATITILVTTRDVAPGERVAAAIVRRDYPVAMVPATALADDDLPADAVALQRITAGEVLVAVDVTHAAGPAALLPSGWLAVHVAATATAAFAVGDSVALLGDGQLIAADGLIVAVELDGLLVGVPAPDAAVVADAVTRGSIAVALSASPRPR